MGAPKGIKVIHAYDPAIVDCRLWFKYKQNGVYFITLEKGNSALRKRGNMDYDRKAPCNEGVQSDEIVGTSNGLAMRRMVYHDPGSG
jgi:hypothetical protein